jgi:prepilin-type N-terminal cleavage/methylation domain-containing protein
MCSKLSPLQKYRGGYTVVELMITVAVIAVVASLAVPSWQRARKLSQADALMNEIRVTNEAFQIYAAEKGSLPANSGVLSAIPAGMTAYMPKNSTWTGVSPTGGYWVWWNFGSGGFWGFTGIIGVYNANFDPAQIAQIDSTMDDGDPNTGGIHSQTNWVFYGIP